MSFIYLRNGKQVNFKKKSPYWASMYAEDPKRKYTEETKFHIQFSEVFRGPCHENPNTIG